MAEMTSLQLMIVELAKCSSSSALKSAVLSVHPHLNDGAYLAELATLQVEGRLVGEEAEGAWFFTSFIDDVVAGRGYYKGLEILACEQAGITIFVPNPLTSGSKAEGRFGKQDFIYLAASDEYRCPAGQLLTRRHTSM